MTAIRSNQISPQHAGHQEMARRGRPDAPLHPPTSPPSPPRPGPGGDHFYRSPEDFDRKPKPKGVGPQRVDKDSKQPPFGGSDLEIGGPIGPIHEPVRKRPVRATRDGIDPAGPQQQPINYDKQRRIPQQKVPVQRAPVDGARDGARTIEPLGEKRLKSPLKPISDAFEAVQDFLRPAVDVLASPIPAIGRFVHEMVDFVREHPESLLMTQPQREILERARAQG